MKAKRTGRWLATLAGLTTTTIACDRPPEPVKAVADAGIDAAVRAFDAGVAADASDEATEQDAGPAAALGWDLDKTDPARDYVRRYVSATRRYAELTDCVVIGKGTAMPAGGGGVGGAKAKRMSVEVRENPTAKCGTSNAVRDVFYVDVAGDRLTVDDPATRAPLAPWPDESKPDRRASDVSTINSVREWRTPLGNAFELMRLTAIRIQGYGRGTYQVITLSGWHTPIARDAGDAKLKETVKKLCEANAGQSFAVTSAMELKTWFRVSCAAGTYKWDLSPVYSSAE